MGKQSPQLPSPPDPVATANAQAQANVAAANQTARLNRVNEVTPTGSSIYLQPGQTASGAGLPGYATAPRGTPTGGAPAPTATWGPDQLFNRGGTPVDLSGNAIDSNRYNSAFGRGQHPDLVSALPAFGSAPDAIGSSGGGGAPGATPASTDAPWTRVSYLDPASQANLEKTQALSSAVLGLGQNQVGRIGTALDQPFNAANLPPSPHLDFSSLGAMPTAPQIDANNPVVQSLYSAQTSRLDPRFAQERDAIEARLASQGITLQTNPEAYSRALTTFNQDRNDAYQNALASAIQTGIGAQGQTFNEQLAARQQGGSELGQQYQAGVGARQNALQEQLALRNQPINELSALLGASPGVATPTFSPTATSSIAPPDIGGLTNANYAGQMQGYQAKLGQQNANVGAVAGLGGSAINGKMLQNALAKFGPAAAMAAL